MFFLSDHRSLQTAELMLKIQLKTTDANISMQTRPFNLSRADTRHDNTQTQQRNILLTLKTIRVTLNKPVKSAVEVN